MPVLGLELRSSVLEARTFTCWTIFLASILAIVLLSRVCLEDKLRTCGFASLVTGEQSLSIMMMLKQGSDKTVPLCLPPPGWLQVLSIHSLLTVFSLRWGSCHDSHLGGDSCDRTSCITKAEMLLFMISDGMLTATDTTGKSDVKGWETSKENVSS